MQKQTGLFGICQGFLLHFTFQRLCTEREEMKQTGCQRFKMWQIIYAPPFKGKVHIHV